MIIPVAKNIPRAHIENSKHHSFLKGTKASCTESLSKSETSNVQDEPEIFCLTTQQECSQRLL